MRSLHEITVIIEDNEHHRGIGFTFVVTSDIVLECIDEINHGYNNPKCQIRRLTLNDTFQGDIYERVDVLLDFIKSEWNKFNKLN